MTKPSMDISESELEALVERLQKGVVSEDDAQKVKALGETLIFLEDAMQQKGASIKRLLKMVFGKESEKLVKQFGTKNPEDGLKKNDKNKKKEGHGKGKSSDIEAGENEHVCLDEHAEGDRCPKCDKGNLSLKAPEVIVRYTGSVPIQCKKFHLERLRCGFCGETFKAPLPKDAGESRFTPSAIAMIACVKYGSAFPFFRLEKLQASCGVKLPSSSQYEACLRGAQMTSSIFDELLCRAAQANLIYNDDTTAKILELKKKLKDSQRKGIYTTGMIAEENGLLIALYRTGNKHAGENLAELLALRSPNLEHPIQMCDGLDHNTPKEFQIIVSNCLAHARRKFIEVKEAFPKEAKFIVETIAKAYRVDRRAKDEKLNAEERLSLHIEHSKKSMDQLKSYLEAKIEKKEVENNSGLGKAILYTLKRWDKLTKFLTIPGAPLDNNLCEQALRTSVLHRKNALFFKTNNGAGTGDLFMSLIHTCRLNNVDPLKYITSILTHEKNISERPHKWMPWNYKISLAELELPNSQVIN